MFNLPIFVGLDYHQNTIQVCVMNQKRQILLNQAVKNDPDAGNKVRNPACVETRKNVIFETERPPTPTANAPQRTCVSGKPGLVLRL